MMLLALLISLNGPWLFAPDPARAGGQSGWHEAAFNDSSWTTVTIPQRQTLQGAVWYRRKFDVPKDAVRKHVRVVFEAVADGAKVWLNGQPVGEHQGGYTPFEVDLSPMVRTGGSNILAVLVEAASATGGIVRGVRLEITNRVYPTRQRALVKDDHVTATVWVRNTLDNTSSVQATFEVLDGDRVIAHAEANATVPPYFTEPIEATFTMPRESIRMWDLDHPNLYTLHTVVSKSVEAVEGGYDTEISSTFGFRRIEIRGAQFLLNGEPVRLGGAVLTGTEDLRDLKEAGLVFNLMANPLPETVLDWADHNGLLLVEATDSKSGRPSIIDGGGFRITKDLSSVHGAGEPVYFVESGSCQTPTALQKNPSVIGIARDVSACGLPREEFVSPLLNNIYQRDGNTYVEVLNRADFPRQVLRGYDVRIGSTVHPLPVLKPGATATVEFELQNPYLVQIRTPGGFVVAGR
jgi:hypothetical protein